MKKIIAFAFAVVLSGCLEGPAESRSTGEKYYPVKVCSLGDRDGSSCVEYAAKSFDTKGSDLLIRTLDGHTYRFNHAGWAWVITIY